MHSRVGIGYDSHLFGSEKPLILGGVTIPNHSGLIAHSDGDALCHAIIDALLGAAAMGDIGMLFPDTDERWSNADSIKLLAEVGRRLEAGSYEIANVDATIVLEQPKLSQYMSDMRRNIAYALGVEVAEVSVKAKTNEKMDSVGEGRGVVVYAVASLGGYQADQ